MELGHTKLTAQGQTVVPSGVRRKFGLGPGSELSWEEVDGTLVVRIVNCSLSDFAALLPPPPPVPVSLEEMEEAIREKAGEGLHGGR